MILFTVTLIAYIFNTVFNLLALFKAKNKKQTIKSDTTDTPLYILMIVNFLLVPDIMFNVTITIINLVNILLDTFRFIRNPLNNKSLLINVAIFPIQIAQTKLNTDRITEINDNIFE